jgi:hypothetical protein
LVGDLKRDGALRLAAWSSPTRPLPIDQITQVSVLEPYFHR